MKRINILDSNVAQLVAAGEVAENPASVVKELVENSIDAGATRITIEIKSGGTKLIKISDNGHGIYRNDIFDAFARHGTSKIKNTEDITKIASLGFRGEALASICAVSELELVTRTKEEKIGTKIQVISGKFGEILDAGCALGTIITVKKLFFNIPARMKFLKTDIAEGNKIASLIDKMALSHPEIFFKLIRDEKIVMETPGDGKISSVIYAVHGKEFYDNTIETKYELNNIKLAGFISKPDKCRPGRNLQSFFVNGRLVKSKILSIALEESFKSMITLGKKPYCVLYLTVPYDQVDVNVHPAKTEVKFEFEDDIFKIINLSITKTLGEYNLMTSPVFEFNNFVHKEINTQTNPELNLSIKNKVAEIVKSQKIGKKQEVILSETPKKSVTKPAFSYLMTENRLDIKPEPVNTSKNSVITYKEPKNNISEENQINVFKKNEFSGKIIGEMFNCYIIMEYEYKVVLIDKHAAHERILYEKLKKQSPEYSSQILLKPINIILEKLEYSAIIENLTLLLQAGYSISDNFNGNIILKSIPMHENLDNIENSIIEISNYLLKNNKKTNTEKLDWLYHNIACRSAIKSGHKTSVEEIKKLVQDLYESPELRNCPHGRPIYVEFDKKIIENKFGRT